MQGCLGPPAAGQRSLYALLSPLFLLNSSPNPADVREPLSLCKLGAKGTDAKKREEWWRPSKRLQPVEECSPKWGPSFIGLHFWALGLLLGPVATESSIAPTTIAPTLSCLSHGSSPGRWETSHYIAETLTRQFENSLEYHEPSRCYHYLFLPPLLPILKS